MADPTTPYLDLTLPIPGDPAGEDLWAPKLNANFTTIDSWAASLDDVIDDAPSDGLIYGRQNATWVETVSPPIAIDDVDLLTGELAAITADIDALEAFDVSIEAYVEGINTNKLDRDGAEVSAAPGYFRVKAQGGAGTYFEFQAPDGEEAVMGFVNTDVTALNRWTFGKDDVAVGPGNAGANLELARWSNTGVWLGNAFSVRRSDGQIDFEIRPTVAGVPLGGQVAVSDAAPASPTDGALWWRSTDGVLMLRYNDGNTTQWVAAGGAPGLADAPADGNEYVRVNGVWRLKSQTFNWAGASGSVLDIAVPAWGPRRAKIRFRFCLPSTSVTAVLARFSIDGTNFPAVLNDYFNSAMIQQGGTTPQVAAYASTGATFAYWTFDGNNQSVPQTGNIELELTRNFATFSWHGMTTSYDNTSTVLQRQFMVTGFLSGGSWGTVASTIKAIRLFTSNTIIPAAGSYVDVEWIA